MRVEVLVAVEYGASEPRPLDIEPVLAQLRRAGGLVGHEVTSIPHHASGRPMRTHRVAFDATAIRNTDVHGMGYRAGFLSHIE